MEERGRGAELGTIDETRIDGLDDGVEAAELERGAQLGRYVVLDAIGAGATGAVYAAFDPELDRKIAIKVLHELTPGLAAPGSASGSAAEQRRLRLLREAQALARLRHPNVVTVYDVGRHADRLFIAMEFVSGTPLGAWLRASPRSVEEILYVYLMAGRGLAAAHAEGLVHRDFKPDNAMVDGAGQVRVLDFGLARAVEDAERDPGSPGTRLGPGVVAEAEPMIEPARDPEPTRAPTAPDAALRQVSFSMASQLTEEGSLIGTPAYMAPEQHLQLPAGPAADQFSFCVALYEALYGQRPFAGDDLAALSANVVGGKLRPFPGRPTVRRGVVRALERGLRPAPEQRWPDMDALLHELGHDPGPARRRRVALGVGGVALASLGVAVALVGPARVDPVAQCNAGASQIDATWSEGSRARLRAAFEASALPYAGAAFERLDSHADAWAASWRAEWRRACGATHAEHRQSETALDLRLACLERRRAELAALVEVLGDPPEGQIETTVERSLDALGSLASPATCAEIERLVAGSSARDTIAGEDPVTRKLRAGLARAHALEDTGDYHRARPEAEALLGEAIAEARPAFEARARMLVASLDGLESADERALAGLEAAYLAAERAADDRLRAELSRLIAVNLGSEAQAKQRAELWLARARALHERVELGARGEIELDFAEGRVLLAAGEVDRATELLAKAAEAAEAVEPDSLTAGRGIWSALASAYRDKARYQEARAIDRRLIERSRAYYGDDHPETVQAVSNLGNTLFLAGEHAAAVEVFEEALAAAERTFGPSSPMYANRLNNYAAALDRVGRSEEAYETYRRAMAIGVAAWGEEDRRLAPYLENLGTVLTSLGRYAEAREHLLRSRALRVEHFGADHPATALNLLNLGWADFKLGDHDSALERFAEGLAVWEARLGVDYADNGLFHNNTAEVLRASGRCREATPAYTRAVELFEPTYGADSPDLLYPLSGRGICHARLGAREEARADLERALEVSAEGSYPPGYLAATCFALAPLVASEDPARARTLAERALEDAEAEPHQPQVPEIRAWLATHPI